MSLGLVPEMRVIEETTEQVWQERERFWINHFRQSGERLTNGTDGGATCNGKRWTQERRKHISEIFKGHTVTPRTRERIGQSRLGTPAYNKLQIDEDALRDMYLRQCLTSYKIAAVFQVSVSAIQSRLRKLGIARTNSQAQRLHKHLAKGAAVDTGIQRMRGN
jgi:hypothetical protein